jgi:hypothetical protein
MKPVATKRKPVPAQVDRTAQREYMLSARYTHTTTLHTPHYMHISGLIKIKPIIFIILF